MRRTGPTSRARRGFTLIEAVTALVILGVAVPPMLWSLRHAQTHRAGGVLASRALWLATEKLEDIIADRHSSTRGYSYLVAANYPAESSITGFPGFTRSVSFSETGVSLSGAGSGYMRITVTVGYTDASGTARSFSLSTVQTGYSP